LTRYDVTPTEAGLVLATATVRLEAVPLDDRTFLVDAADEGLP
jgi:hypothetical protein